MKPDAIARAASAPKLPSCMACHLPVRWQQRYLGMELHLDCLLESESRRLADQALDPGPTCRDCDQPIGVRDYAAVYPWDSQCDCYPEPAAPPIVNDCPVCGETHEVRICPVNEKSLLFQPCKRCHTVHPFYSCKLPDGPAPEKKPGPKRAPAPRERIAEKHAG